MFILSGNSVLRKISTIYIRARGIYAGPIDTIRMEVEIENMDRIVHLAEEEMVDMAKRNQDAGDEVEAIIDVQYSTGTYVDRDGRTVFYCNVVGTPVVFEKNK